MLAAEPQVARSWAADCVGLMHEDHIWQPSATAWQTAAVGEAAVVDPVAPTAQDFIAIVGSLCMTTNIAARVRRGVSNEMPRCYE